MTGKSRLLSVNRTSVALAVFSWACASAPVAREPLELGASFGGACIGVADAGGIRVWYGAKTALVDLPGEVGSGVLTANGDLVIARGLTIDVSRRPFTSHPNALTSAPVDTSADGALVAWRSRESSTRARSVIVSSPDTGLESFTVAAGEEISLSPNGRRIAVGSAGTIQIYERGKSLGTVAGTRPSWWDDGTLAYLDRSQKFRLTDLDKMQSRLLHTVGRPVGPVRRSFKTGYVLYATRTARDRATAPWSSCPEHYRVVLQLKPGPEALTHHYGCVGSDPASFQWINSAAVCAAAREQLR